MNAREFRTALDRLNLSQIDAAEILHANARTVRRWAHSELRIMPQTAILIRLMQADILDAKTIWSAGPPTMTEDEFVEALGQLELSDFDAAELFRVSPQTVNRWYYGDSKVPPGIAILLRLMLAGRIAAADIAATKP